MIIMVQGNLSYNTFNDLPSLFESAEDGGGMITLWKFPADRGILFRRPGSLICAWIDAATHGCDIERIGGSAAITDRRH